MTHNKLSLSRALGVSPSYMSHWLQGRRRFTPSRLQQVADILDLPVECLAMPAGRPMVEARLRHNRPKALTRREYNMIYAERRRKDKERLEYLEKLLQVKVGS